MKIPHMISQRKVAIMALALIVPIMAFVFLLSSSLTSAQSDNTPQSVEAAVGTAFTYQGRLNQDGQPANGSFSFKFALFDSQAGGSQIGNTQTKNVTVSNGVFTTLLNEAGQFGTSAFTGEARFLEISVSSDGGNNYTTLAPRQPLTATPYAHSLRPGAFIDSSVNNGSILVLKNSGSNGFGLSVNSTNSALFVEETKGDGLFVCNTGPTTGCNPNDSLHNGVEVAKAEHYGLWVTETVNGDGVFVDKASDDGFQIANAGDDGIDIGAADDGVRVRTVGGDGMEVEQATNGVRITKATQDGLFVCATGNQSGCTPNDSIHSGVEVGKAEHYGLWVTEATNGDGVFVVKASDDGFQVTQAGDDGLDVTAVDDGVRVRSATHGVHVESATHGVQVDSATGIGLFVKSAINGVQVDTASGIGVNVGSAVVGVQVDGPATNWAGSFTGNVQVTGTCTGCLLATFGINTGNSALQVGDVATVQGTRSGEDLGQAMLMEVSQAGQVGDSVVGVVYGRGELVTTEKPNGETVTQLVPREGAAQAGDFVHIVTYGPVQVKASALNSAIQVGDRLSMDSSGVARGLQTRELDGMLITEGAPTIGTALEGLDTSADGMIWVLVNPQ